ncbi:MAG: DUF2202 domain-containing protein [Dermatophilus congolensis]|nr:DUF2202 domain-containing protein [Dermatophilus congolensis]
MKRTSRILAAAAALALSGTTVATAAAFGQGNGNQGGPSTSCSRAADCPQNPASAETPAVKLTAQQAYDLSYSREEERVARDLYKAFADMYDGARPFSNITKSEQNHFDAVGRMLTRYGLDDPSDGKAAGTYAYPVLQKNYDAWLTQGKKSQVEAAKAGVELEVEDIATLEASLEKDLPADVTNVYENLLAGSRNHLNAFTRAASGQAVDQGQRQGRGQGQGQGQGRGQGQGQGRGGGVGQGACDGSGDGVRKADGTGGGRQDGTGPRAGTADCPRTAS